MFKKTALLALSTAAAITIASSSAFAFKCQANSPSAWGQGWHNYSLSYAQGRALSECAARTPRNQVCRISWCR